MQDNYIDEPVVETADGEHVNPDGETDSTKAMRAGGIGGAVTGAVAGSLMGPAGALLGAAVGGLVGAVASGAAVSAVDKADGDSLTDHPIRRTDDEVIGYHNDDTEVLGNGVPGIQTGGYANDGTPDTRGILEKTADAVTGDIVDDKTGKVVDDRREDWDRNGLRDLRYNDPLLPTSPPVVNPHGELDAEPLGNGIPGIQTGGHATDGTPDTRGISEKTADALTGDTIDDKTGKRVS